MRATTVPHALEGGAVERGVAAGEVGGSASGGLGRVEALVLREGVNDEREERNEREGRRT